VPSELRSPSAFSAVPPVIKNLMIVNGLVFLAQAVFDWLPAGTMQAIGPVMIWGALWPAGAAEAAAALGQAVPAFYPWQLITTAFLHGSVLHIAFNMFGLFSIGPPVEEALGTRRFLAFYLVSVLGASLLQLAIVSYPFWTGTIGPVFPTVGASGGLLGVVAAFGILYPKATLFIFPIPFPIQARWLVPGAALVSLYLGVTGRADGIAHFAHLGGMVAGAIFVLIWRSQRRSRRLA
jgi:membrane associated rhomboid family serine protease